MYRVTMPVGNDPQSLFATCDTLEDATAEALILSRSTRRLTENLDLCWVDIRDVRGVIIKSVNIWRPNASKPKM